MFHIGGKGRGRSKKGGIKNKYSELKPRKRKKKKLKKKSLIKSIQYNPNLKLR